MLAFSIVTYIIIAIVVIALIFGAILGYSSVKLKVEEDPIVGNVATQVANLMRKPLPMAMRLPNVCQVVSL